MKPDYYMMTDEEDLFAWIKRLPIPAWLAEYDRLHVALLWFTGFRYARRCLWKGQDAATCAEDAAKAADCFMRLAQVLRWKDEL